MVTKVIGQKVMTSQVMRMKSPILYHLSASVLFMKKLPISFGTGIPCSQHIKYRVDFLKIGSYPKICINQHGEWETQVERKSMSVC